MKKLIPMTCALLILGGIMAHGAKYDFIDVYICSESKGTAELSARSTVSRRELYRPSMCKCEGVNANLKAKVRKGTWKYGGYEFEYGTCTPPRDRVFHCVCFGKNQI